MSRKTKSISIVLIVKNTAIILFQFDKKKGEKIIIRLIFREAK